VVKQKKKIYKHFVPNVIWANQIKFDVEHRLQATQKTARLSQSVE